VLDLSQYIYEFVALSVPMKKLHPRFDGEPSEDALVYSSSDEMQTTEQEATDPRWAALKKLKKN
ncbi:MAG: YceD family protein, partial [Cyclobacteriaceae bacterium]